MWVSARCNNSACVEVWFHAASASNPSGNCVEVGFRKASASHTSSCVEVAQSEECPDIHVQDSKNAKLGKAVVVDFPRSEWDGGALLKGKFIPVSAEIVPVDLRALREASEEWFSLEGKLFYGAEEVAAFLDGVEKQEFAAV